MTDAEKIRIVARFVHFCGDSPVRVKKLAAATNLARIEQIAHKSGFTDISSALLRELIEGFSNISGREAELSLDNADHRLAIALLKTISDLE